MNKRRKMNWNYLLIAPALIISVCVILVPGIMTVVYSFTDWNGLSPDINFIGIQNYQELFHDNVFFIAIKNNFIWAIMFLTIPVVIGMLSAMLLLSRKKTRSIYQVAFLIFFSFLFSLWRPHIVSIHQPIFSNIPSLLINCRYKITYIRKH